MTFVGELKNVILPWTLEHLPGCPDLMIGWCLIDGWWSSYDAKDVESLAIILDDSCVHYARMTYIPTMVDSINASSGLVCT
jgi:hypothetical protein